MDFKVSYVKTLKIDNSASTKFNTYVISFIVKFFNRFSSDSVRSNFFSFSVRDFIKSSLSATFFLLKSCSIITNFANPINNYGTSNGAETIAVGTNSAFGLITGIALDQNGLLWIADNGNCAIRFIDTNDTIYVTYTVAGGSGCESQISEESLSQATFTSISSITLSSTGDLFVSDGNMIKKIQNIVNYGQNLVKYVKMSMGSILTNKSITFTTNTSQTIPLFYSSNAISSCTIPVPIQTILTRNNISFSSSGIFTSNNPNNIFDILSFSATCSINNIHTFIPINFSIINN